VPKEKEMDGSHMLQFPRWITFVRIAQIVLSVIVLGTSAYGIYWVPYSVQTPCPLFLHFLTSQIANMRI